MFLCITIVKNVLDSFRDSVYYVSMGKKKVGRPKLDTRLTLKELTDGVKTKSVDLGSTRGTEEFVRAVEQSGEHTDKAIRKGMYADG